MLSQQGGCRDKSTQFFEDEKRNDNSYGGSRVGLHFFSRLNEGWWRGRADDIGKRWVVVEQSSVGLEDGTRSEPWVKGGLFL